MKKNVVATVLVAILVPMLIVGGYYLNLYAFAVYRYEITVTVETPEGLKTGSAVRQGTNFSIKKLIEQPPYYQGEAAVVDLGERGLLYVLREGPPRRRQSSLTTVENIRGMNATPIGYKDVLKESQYPRMVTLKNPKDIKSAELARGWKYNHKYKRHLFEDNIEKIFGKGVRIKEVVVEKTDKPLTNKIEPYMPDNYEDVVIKGWYSLPEEERQRLEQIVVLVR